MYSYSATVLVVRLPPFAGPEDPPLRFNEFTSFAAIVKQVAGKVARVRPGARSSKLLVRLAYTGAEGDTIRVADDTGLQLAYHMARITWRRTLVLWASAVPAPCLLPELPEELTLLVLARLDAKSLGRAASCCHALARLEKAHGALWETMCKKDLRTFQFDGRSADEAGPGGTPATLGLDWKAIYHMHAQPPAQPPVQVEALNERFAFFARLVMCNCGTHALKTDRKHTGVRLRMVPLSLASSDGHFSFQGDSAGGGLVEWPRAENHGDDGPWPMINHLAIYVRDRAAQKMALLMEVDGVVEVDKDTSHLEHYTTVELALPRVWHSVARAAAPAYATIVMPFVGDNPYKWDCSTLRIEAFQYEGGGDEDVDCDLEVLGDVLSSPRMHWLPCAPP